MINVRKLRREARRISRQAWSGPIELRARLLNALWPWLGRYLTEVRDGECRRAAQIAVFLVFQPRGCPESLFDTLAVLRGEGYAPLVVVNGRHRRDDLDRLVRLAWRVMLRPNVGYDFGGYRDGIRHIRALGIEVEALLILNDTIWLPAGQESFTLRRLGDIGGDYAALSNFVYRHQRGRAVHLTGRTYASSFGFRVSRRVWRSCAFQNFWTRLPLLGSKPKVVERGEVGFSRAMEAAGFAPVTLLDHAETVRTVLGLPSNRQARFLHQLPVLNHGLRARHSDLIDRLDRAVAGPAEVAAFLNDALPELNPWDSMVVCGLVEGRIDFAKKANLKDPTNAARFLESIDRTGFHLNQTVRREIEAFARASE